MSASKLSLRHGSFRWIRPTDHALVNGFWNVGGARQFELHFGAYGSTCLRVWALSFDEAFELCAEWLDDNEPGHLCNIDLGELLEAAEELLGESCPGLKAGSVADLVEAIGEDDFNRVVEHAEQDLTLISHTTLKHGQYVASWEWTGREVGE